MGPLTQAPPRPVYGLELFRLLLQGIYRRPEAPSGIRGCQSLWASEFPASAPCRRDGGSPAFCLELFAKSGLPLGDEAAVIVDLHRHLPLALSGDRNPSVLILVQLLDP